MPVMIVGEATGRVQQDKEAEGEGYHGYFVLVTQAEKRILDLLHTVGEESMKPLCTQK